MAEKLMAIAMTVVLAMGLYPALAYATEDDLLTAAPVSVQASKKAKSEKVILQLRTDAPNIKYNKNGLVSKNSFIQRGNGGAQWFEEIETYKYDSAGHLVKYKHASRLYGYEKDGRIIEYEKKGKQSTVSSWGLKYDKKGRLVQQKGDGYKLTYKYSNKNRKVNITAIGTSTISKYDKYSSVVKLSKKGYVTSVKDVKYRFWGKNGLTDATWHKEYSDTYSYEYDKHGNAKRRKAKHSKFSPFQAVNGYGNMTSKNSYDKNGVLVSHDGAAISYKTVTVPKKYASAVKTQQRALLNPSLLAPRFGIDSLLNGAYQFIY